MGSYARLVVGILGNVTSLLLYAVPIITFKRVWKKKSTEEFSSVPYVIAFFNCVLYTLYGTPLISNGSENILLSTVNGVGALLECCYICIYIVFAPSTTKRNATRMVVSVLLLFGTVVGVSVLGFHSHKSRKMVVGIVTIISSVLLYGSPLSVIRLVVRTWSVEFMPFHLSFFSFLASALWFIYGALGRDLYVMAPNILGLPMSVGQLVLYCIYRNKSERKCDLELGIKKNGDMQTIKQEMQTKSQPGKLPDAHNDDWTEHHLTK